MVSRNFAVVSRWIGQLYLVNMEQLQVHVPLRIPTVILDEFPWPSFVGGTLSDRNSLWMK